MDPAVIAAIIPTPVALLAAAAAYAAGRTQGRGAYRGPVDAVRRQHQRDAYAAFLTAANDFMARTDWGPCLDEARREFIRFRDIIYPEGSEDRLREDVEQRAAEIRAAVSVGPLQTAAAVIALEGPDLIAERADEVVRSAEEHRREFERGHGGYMYPLRALERGESLPDGPTARTQLLEAMRAFTRTARAHLNGEKPSGE